MGARTREGPRAAERERRLVRPVPRLVLEHRRVDPPRLACLDVRDGLCAGCPRRRAAVEKGARQQAVHARPAVVKALTSALSSTSLLST